MAKDKKTVTNAMRLLNASKIKYETVEYEADEVGEHFGEAIAEMTGIPPEKSFKTLVAKFIIRAQIQRMTEQLFSFL